jgi:hypothetical protein
MSFTLGADLGGKADLLGEGRVFAVSTASRPSAIPRSASIAACECTGRTAAPHGNITLALHCDAPDDSSMMMILRTTHTSTITPNTSSIARSLCPAPDGWG